MLLYSPRTRARFVVDIENVGNLLAHNRGPVPSVPFRYFTPAVDISVDRTTGVYHVLESAVAQPDQGASTADLLLPVWRVSLGLMYDF